MSQKAKVFIYDEFGPQDTAMLQALYSRSPMSVTSHVKKVQETGSGNFMEQFYVGYGHSSIADCGSTTLFIEGISTLADKAIQDWPLYSGQETSTRYVDMSMQPIIDPVSNHDSKKILVNWMDFYLNSFALLEEHLRQKYPIKKDEKESVYEKALKARAFDILRGFLPAGIATQLSWHTNLRQAYDKLSLLKYHPLEEVRGVAEEIIDKLKVKYPQSFCHKSYSETEKYREYLSENYSYFEYPEDFPDFSFIDNLDKNGLKKYKDLLKNRPPKTNLPHFFSEFGSITFEFKLDFGCFRDLQRHRNGVCLMPLLTTGLGFNNWYLNQLPENLKKQAENLISKQKFAVEELNASEEEKQYYIAMGFNVACRVTYGLMAAVYVTELRSGKTVHPALRLIALKMNDALAKVLPELALHSDLDPDDWDIRRGKQDISFQGKKHQSETESILIQ